MATPIGLQLKAALEAELNPELLSALQETLDLYARISGMRISEDRKLTAENTAICIYPGLRDYRITATRINEVPGAPIFVAGTRGDPHYTEEQIRRLLGFQGDTSRRLICQIDADNAKEQAHWISEQIKHPEFLGITNLLKSTSAHHIYRCTGGFVKSQQDIGDDRKLQISVNGLIDAQEPEKSFSAEGFERVELDRDKEFELTSDSMLMEMLRYLVYQEKGDLASLQQVDQFIRHGWN